MAKQTENVIITYSAIDPNHYQEIDAWRMDNVKREKVFVKFSKELEQKLKEPTKEMSIDSKLGQVFITRLQQIVTNLKKFIKSYDNPLPKIRYRRHFNCERDSILNHIEDIFAALFWAIPISVATPPEQNFLHKLFVSCGGLQSMFLPWENPSALVREMKKIHIYCLSDTADIYSAIDSLFENYLTTDSSCFKIFSQESFKDNIEKAVKSKLTNQLSNIPIKVSYDAVDFSANELGISFYYYRNISGMISMVNRLNPSKTHFISIWQEATSVSLKIARQLFVTSKNISINCSNGTNPQPYGRWPLELNAEPLKFSVYIDEVDLQIEKPSEGWQLATNRVKILEDIVNRASKESSLSEGQRKMNQIIKAFLQCGNLEDQSIYYEDQRVNRLQLDYKTSLGMKVIILSNDEYANEGITNPLYQTLAIFCFKLLIEGNFVIFLSQQKAGEGRERACEGWWKSFITNLGRSREGRSIVQWIEIDQDQKDKTSKFAPGDIGGVRYLEKDKEASQALLIDLSTFDKDRYGYILEWIRIRSHQGSVSMTLEDYEMKNIVE